MDPNLLKQLAERLAASGAVMTTWNSPVAHYLIGDFQWLDRNEVFWFAANGDTAADAHVLRYDGVELVDGKLRFFSAENLVGILAPIDDADVEDRDDYRVAWSIWQQVAPARRALLEEARAAHSA